MSINMILSIDNDLSIGFPISDFIDWSGRNMAKDHGNSLFSLINAISLVVLYTYRFVLNRFLSYLLLYCSCSTLFLNCSLLLYFFLAVQSSGQFKEVYLCFRLVCTTGK